jgi:hypothetical protein
MYWQCLSDGKGVSVENINLHIYISTPLLHNTRQKFGYIQTILNNAFCSPADKESLIRSFQKAQKTYHAFMKLATIYRRKKAAIQIQHDLFMNPIQESHRHVYSVIQNRSKYLFTIMDLIKMIETALSHAPYYVSKPLPVKNPYNNMTFSKATLYSIYFFMKHSDVVMSTLFHRYFLANFNLKEFKNRNGVLIRDCAIKNAVESENIHSLYNDCKLMIQKRNQNHSKKYHIIIHKEFPKERFVQMMRPYLHLYYTSYYSLDLSARYWAEDKLERELNRVQQTNPFFGRKQISRNIFSEKPTVQFNDTCCGFAKHMNDDTSHMIYESDDDLDFQPQEEEDDEEDGNEVFIYDNIQYPVA